MLENLFSNWSPILTVGAAIAFGGSVFCLFAAIFCFLRMEWLLRSQNKISTWDFAFPRTVYIRFRKLTETNLEFAQNYGGTLKLFHRFLLALPLVLMIGLTILALGKSL